MQVQITPKVSFKSRNQTIRFADDIARRVNQAYPRISSTKVSCFEHSSEFKNFVDDLTDKTLNAMRYFKDVLYDSSESLYDRVKSFIIPVKEYKLGNCGESAQLASIVAKINGIKNSHMAHLYNKDGENLDHAVLFVNDKKPYIIDPWLGFADYVPNTIERYKSEYNNIFGDEEMTFVSYIDDEYTDFLKDNFTRKQINKLKRMYPDLVIKRGYV